MNNKVHLQFSNSVTNESRLNASKTSDANGAVITRDPWCRGINGAACGVPLLLQLCRELVHLLGLRFNKASHRCIYNGFLLYNQHLLLESPSRQSTIGISFSNRHLDMSSVASESAFSTAGRHITPHRNRLHPDLVEILICTQDWLWDDNLGPHSNKQNYLGKSEVVKDDDSYLFLYFQLYRKLNLFRKWVPVGFPIPGGDYFTRTRREFGGAGAGMGLGSEVGDGDGYCSPRPHPSPFASLSKTEMEESPMRP
ncbi:hypothetical protein LXL04_014022 [Taraxacum kok-saghyz]